MPHSMLKQIKQKREDYKHDVKLFKALYRETKDFYALDGFRESIKKARYCNALLFKK